MMRATWLGVLSVLAASCGPNEQPTASAPPAAAAAPAASLQAVQNPAPARRPQLTPEDVARALEGYILSRIDDDPNWAVQSRMDCGATDESRATYLCKVRVNDYRAPSGAQVLVYLYAGAPAFGAAEQDIRDHIAGDTDASLLESTKTINLRTQGYPQLDVPVLCLQALRARSRAYCLLQYGPAVLIAHVPPTAPDPRDDLKSPDIQRAAELLMFALMDVEDAVLGDR